MTEAPEKIRASLTAVRDGWYQMVNTRGGQRAFPQTEYTRSDIADTLRAEVERLREALEHSKTGWENVIELELLDPAHDFTASVLLYEARAALAHGEADQ
tara:strand:- start:2501 stop:2800 length:300 start_codon:yes stop_codon:yes gene_type:complete